MTRKPRRILILVYRMWDITSAVACVAGVRKETERHDNNLFSSLSNSCQEEGYEYRMPLLPGNENTSLFCQKHIWGCGFTFFSLF